MAFALNKVTLAWPNRVDQAGVTGGSWLDSLPLTNLQTRILAEKARTNGTLGSDYEGANQLKYSQDLTISAGGAWSVGTAAVAITATLYGTIPYCSITKTVATTSEQRGQTLNQPRVAGDYQTLTFAIRAGSVASVGFGIAAQGDTWGANADANATITSGPGALTRVTGALFNLTGLSATVDTLITLTRRFASAATTSTVSFYPGTAGSNVIGNSVLVTAVQLENAAYPCTYIATNNVAPVSRTLNSRFEIGLDTTRPIGAIALAAHNLTPSATVRVRLFGDYAKTILLWDSGALPAWPASYVFESLEWESNNFWLGNNAVDPTTDYTALFTAFADQNYSVQLIAIDILDASNPAGYVEIGRCFVANVWQPTYNMDYGVQHGFLNTTGVDQALDKTEYFDRQRAPRTVQFSLSNMSASEAFNTVFTMRRDLGIDKELLYAYSLTPSDQSYARTFLARNKEINPLTHPYLNSNSTPFSLQEIL